MEIEVKDNKSRERVITTPLMASQVWKLGRRRVRGHLSNAAAAMAKYDRREPASFIVPFHLGEKPAYPEEGKAS